MIQVGDLISPARKGNYWYRETPNAKSKNYALLDRRAVLLVIDIDNSKRFQKFCCFHPQSNLYFVLREEQLKAIE